ncbi:MAG: ComF family protein [Eubacteriales bacterium]|jgi:ComF family protein
MKAIWKFKYGGKTYLNKPLGRLLAGVVKSLIDLGDSEMKLEKGEIAGLVPVPLAKKRLRQRGFNQSELLAGAVSYNLGLPVLPLLNKARETPAQTGLSREQRQSNLAGVFGVSQCKIPVGKSVILIDDVFTTGSTVSDCSRILLSAGLKSVFVATVTASVIR